jgi:hypothetical protein
MSSIGLSEGNGSAAAVYAALAHALEDSIAALE